MSTASEWTTFYDILYMELRSMAQYWPKMWWLFLKKDNFREIRLKRKFSIRTNPRVKSVVGQKKEW